MYIEANKFDKSDINHIIFRCARPDLRSLQIEKDILMNVKKKIVALALVGILDTAKFNWGYTR